MSQDLRLLPSAVLLWLFSIYVLNFPAQLGIMKLVAGTVAFLSLVGFLVSLLVSASRANDKSAASFGFSNLLTSFSKAVIPQIFLISSLGLISAFLVEQKLSDREIIELDNASADYTEQFLKVELNGYCRENKYETLNCPAQLIGFSRTTELASNIAISLRFPKSLEIPAALEVGTRLTITGNLTKLSSAEANAYRVKVLSIGSFTAAQGIESWFNPIRHALQVQAENMSGGGGELLPGLAIGDTRLVSEPLDEAMKTSSLSHLTAVSGANCAVIVVAFLLGARNFGISRFWRSAVALVGLGLFVVLVTAEPSVLRAGVMASLALAANTFGRQPNGIAALSSSIVILLLFDPWLALNYGFALSAAATLGLLCFTRPISNYLSRFLWPGLALALAVPIAAQLACQAILLAFSPTIPSYSIAANLLAAPAAPLATVLGLLAALFLYLVPVLGEGLSWLAWIPATWIARLAEFFAGLPLAKIDWLEGALGIIVMAVSVILMLLAVTFRSRLIQVSKTLWLYLLIILAATLFGKAVVSPNFLSKDWIIAGCDVGQGDAFLIKSNNLIALIDTGPDPKLLAECLSFLQISELELVILSHFDSDHVGGLAGLEQLTVKSVIAAANTEDEQEQLASFLKTQSSSFYQAKAGLVGNFGEFSWKIYWPESESFYQDSNSRSVVIGFSGPITFLALGDVGEQVQNQIALQQQIPNQQVVKISHHGSADQSLELYEQLAAEIGVIGVGHGNSYGHPTQKALELVKTKVFRTDQHGHFLIGIDQDGALTAWTEKSVP